MTPRPHARTRRAALVTFFAGASLLSLPGCDPRTLLFFLQPYDPTIPAPGPSLKGKKVVVLAHISPNAGSDFSDLVHDLPREFVREIRKNAKHVEVIDPDKVASWAEAHPSWTNPSEAAEAFEADIAILLDVSTFQAQDSRSPGLMEGTSNVHIQVWEIAHPKDSKGHEKKNLPKEPSKVYEEQADTVFPKRGPVSTDTGVSAAAFRIKFLKLIAKELSWHFVEHAPGDDIQDVKFNSQIQ